jgi:hypothetical protein
MKLADYQPSCERCSHWHEQSDSGDEARWGECRRYPPVPFLTDDANVSAMFPPTVPGEVCGEFGAKQ